jgi:ABC-type multidrug transport system fused ATPase/permease subunit
MIFQTIAIIIGITVVMWYLTILVIFELVLVHIVQKKFRNSSRETKRLASVNEAKITNLMNEMIKGVPVIRAFGK